MPALSIEDFYRAHRSSAARRNEKGLIASLYPEIAEYVQKGFTKRLIWQFLMERGDITVCYSTFCRLVAECSKNTRLSIPKLVSEKQENNPDLNDWEPIRPPVFEHKTFEVTTQNADPESYFVK